MIYRITQYNRMEDWDVHVWEMEEEKQLKSWKNVLTNFHDMNKNININPTTIEELINNLNEGSKSANKCGLIRYGFYFYRLSTKEDIEKAIKNQAYNIR